MAARVLLLHWNPAEAAERADRLRRAGFQAELLPDPRDGNGLRLIRDNPPDAVVIDLTRQPSHGLQSASFLRSQKPTRNAALVFIEGDPEKTDQIRALLPDAVFTTWPRIGAAVKRALKNRPEEPIKPGIFAGYSGVPLSKKLRIAEGSTVALIHAPTGFESKLAPLPTGVRLQKGVEGASVILAFMKSAGMLGRELPKLARVMRAGYTLWLIWPKKTSELASDLGQTEVREMGLSIGLVDYKICAVDETWSGLAFAVRKAKK